jgi:hypothetical protein
MPYKINQDRRHKIPRAGYRVKNWRDYDAALRRRGDLTIWVTAEAIEAGHRHPPAGAADHSYTPRLLSRRA